MDHTRFIRGLEWVEIEVLFYIISSDSIYGYYNKTRFIAEVDYWFEKDKIAIHWFIVSLINDKKNFSPLFILS